MMDYIAGLVQRGLISPDVAQGLVQRVNDITKGPLGQPPLAGDVGRGQVIGGASGKPTVAPDYSRPIHPDVLRAMRSEQGLDRPETAGRPIHPDVLRAMREEQGTAPANQNMTPREQFIDEYDALVRQKAAQQNRADMIENTKKLTRKQRLVAEAREAMMRESRERMTHLGAPTIEELKGKE